METRSVEEAAFVKDGFCWPALFIAVIWLIYRRMWLVLLAYLVAAVGLAWLTMSLAEPAATGIAILFAIWFALEANNLRRWTLEGTGWRMIGVSEGRDRLAAEYNFYAADQSLTVPVPPVPPAPPSPPERPAVPPTPQPPQTPVVGLFPEPRPR
jgi:hypothetical protein